MQSFRQQRLLNERLQYAAERTTRRPNPPSRLKAGEEKADHESQRGTTDDTGIETLRGKSSAKNGTGDQIEDDPKVNVGMEWSEILNETYDDLINPKSWPVTCRWMYTAIIAGTGCLVSFASSNAAPTVPQAMVEYGITEEVALLACTTYFIMFGVGTMIAAPLTEVFGRNPVYIISMFVFGLFSIGSALAPNIHTQATCRAFMGLFASTPLVTIGGSIGDLWPPLDRTYVFPTFACSFFISSFIAPLIGDAIAVSPYVSWHFTEWISLIWTALIVALFIVFMPETYGPVMEAWKVRILRELLQEQQRDPAFLEGLKAAELDWNAVGRSIWRPIAMLLVEPILDLFALYLVLIWVVLFGFLPGYSYIFGENGIYGLDQLHTGLCFLPINVGFLIGLLPVLPLYHRFKTKLAFAEESGDGRVPPEERLVLSMVGAPFLPIGIFWLAWTAWPSISLWLPLFGGMFVGYATISIFVSCIQYLIDAFELYTASALVGMTMTRYVISGPMVIVSVPMYRNLGHHWALTILGCIATMMTAVPYLFYYYGARIRKMSRNMRHDT